MISRRHFVITGAALAASPLAVSAQDASTPTAPFGGGAQADGSWRFVDSVGAEIALDAMPTTVLAQTTSGAALWDLGYKVAGIYGPGQVAGAAPDPQLGNLDMTDMVYIGDYGQPDIEAVVALGPDLYVDVDRGNGMAWYLDEETTTALESLCPIALIKAGGNSVLDTIQQFEQLAAALGADIDAPEVSAARDAWKAAEDAFKAAVEAKPGLKALAVSPDATQVYVVNSEWVGDLIYLRSLGLDVTVPENPDPGTFNNFEIISWEEIGKYSDEADLILVDSRNTPDWADGLTFWESLPAVEAGQVGAWYGVFPFTYEGLTGMLTAMTETIDATEVLGS